MILPNRKACASTVVSEQGVTYTCQRESDRPHSRHEWSLTVRRDVGGYTLTLAWLSPITYAKRPPMPRRRADHALPHRCGDCRQLGHDRRTCREKAG